MAYGDLDAFTGDPVATRDAVADLYGRDLVNSDFDGVWLTPFGGRTAGLLRQSLLTGQRRADIVQRALLQWLDGRAVEPGSIDNFAGTLDASAMGVPMTVPEIHQAAELLGERGFIQSIATAEVGWLRPRITADGRAALMSDVLISEYGRANPTTISYDYSSQVTFGDHATTGGVIAGGQGNTQHIVQTIGEADKAQLAAKLSELLALVDQLPGDAGRDQLRDTLVQLEGEAAAPAPRKSALKDLTVKALGAAATTTGTAGGQQLLEGIAQLARMLG